MNKKIFSVRDICTKFITSELECFGGDVEDNKHSLGDGMQQALKAEPMASLLTDTRGKA